MYRTVFWTLWEKARVGWFERMSLKHVYYHQFSSVQSLSRVQLFATPWIAACQASLYHLSGSSQYTSPKHPVSCIEPRLAIHFLHDSIHVSMPFSQIIPPSPSPTESKSLFYTSVSLLLSHIQGYHYHLSKFHIYVLVYCIGVFLSRFTLYNRLWFHPPH